MPYVFSKHMLSEYNADGSKWRQKSAAVYLVTSLSERGSTAKHGVTKASELVVLPEFTQQYILPELEKDSELSIISIHTDWKSFTLKFGRLYV